MEVIFVTKYHNKNLFQKKTNIWSKSCKNALNQTKLTQKRLLRPNSTNTKKSVKNVQNCSKLAIAVQKKRSIPMKVSIIMTKRLKKKCLNSETFFDYTCPKLATKRPKRPNSTKTENRSKTKKKRKETENCLGMIFTTKYQNTFFLTKNSFFDQNFSKTFQCQLKLAA